MVEATLSQLAGRISHLHEQTQRAAARQINYWLTVRNWLIGYYIAEYEQHGDDRAAYGEQLLPELARQLQSVRGLAVRRLYQCREFYAAYPEILQTVSAELQRLDILDITTSVAKRTAVDPTPTPLPGVAPELLLSRLSFSHFLELLPLLTHCNGLSTRCRQ